MRIPFFCSYIPAALLEALGHELVDISLFTEETCGLEYSCSLHDNLCSYVKYLYRKILSDGAGFDFAVIPNTCDAMKKLHGALGFSGRMPSFLLDIPRRISKGSAVYLATEYGSLLASLTMGIGVEEVLARLSARHMSLPSRPETISSIDDDGPGVLKIGISGSSYSPSFFRAALARCRGSAVFLRHCGYGTVSEGVSPRFPFVPAGPASLQELLLQMAETSLRRTVCPRSDRGSLTEFIEAEIARLDLDGLIFHSLKFCDFYAFEFERLRVRQSEDYPLLYLENDLSINNDEQNRTRIEAFMEKIASGRKGEQVPRTHAAAKSSTVMAMGLDIGSATTKGILVKGGRSIVASVIIPTSINMKDGAAEAMMSLMEQGGVERRDVARIVLTGYGRTAFPEMEQITEITCHALGVHFLRADGCTVIDVGGQDSKAIRIDKDGRVLRFTMNDKCAAGTGKFFESMVRRLNISFEEFSALSLSASEATPISSMCSVFAESEVVSLMARGIPASHITRGLNAAVAARVRGLVGKIQGEGPFVLTGGLARSAGFIRELEAALGAPVAVFHESQLAGAIGAALAASSGEGHVADG